MLLSLVYVLVRMLLRLLIPDGQGEAAKVWGALIGFGPVTCNLLPWIETWSGFEFSGDGVLTPQASALEEVDRSRLSRRREAATIGKRSANLRKGANRVGSYVHAPGLSESIR
jgi:hypothetical protein